MNTPTPANLLVPLDRARWRLATIWFGFSGLVFLILIGQSIGDVYGEDVLRAWGWALPNFLPTLALMVSVFAADALKPPSADGPKVRRNFLRLSYYISLFYLAVFLFTLVSPPIALSVRGRVEERAIDILELSNLWLAPIQGLVIALVGVLFFLKENDKDQADG
jgi:hypothetical protein